jgi:PAS domain S-box-containing protein
MTLDPAEPIKSAMRHYKLYSEHFRPGFLSDQDALFSIVFDESPDAIFILHPGNFSIIDCNIKAVQLFQVNEKSDLTGRESFELYDSEPAEFSKNTYIDTINKGIDHRQEMAFRSLKGNVFWGTCSLKRIDTAKGPVIVFRVRRVVDYMKTAEMLATMIKHTARVTGMEYFSVLTELLVKSFGVSLAFIARVDEEAAEASIIKCWHKQQITECESFHLATSPCLNVLKGYATYYPSNLKEMFPEDKLIHNLGMESFMGTPVFDVKGEVCGLVVLMDDKPMEEIPNSRYMLSIFASRVGAELERMMIEESYKRKIEELQTAIRNLTPVGTSQL